MMSERRLIGEMHMGQPIDAICTKRRQGHQFVADKEEVALLKHDSSVYCLAFTPDDTRLAGACADNTIRLWDVAFRHEVADLLGHNAYVHCLAFSPDGTRLVTGSGDFTVRIWDTLSVQERALVAPASNR